MRNGASSRPAMPRRRISGSACLAGGGQGEQRRDRGGVGEKAEEILRQLEPSAHPVEHREFELGGRGAGPPQHAVDVEGGRQHLPEHAGARAGDAEVGHEAGVVPVGHAGQDDLEEILPHRFRVLGGVGHSKRQPAGDLARFDAGEHRVLAVAAVEVFGDPVHHPVAFAAEQLRVPVARFVSHRDLRRLP